MKRDLQPLLLSLLLCAVVAVGGAIAGTTGLSTAQARTAAPVTIGSANAEGTSLAFARADHVHLGLRPAQYYQQLQFAGCRIGRADASTYGCFGYANAWGVAGSIGAGSTSNNQSTGQSSAYINIGSVAADFVAISETTNIGDTSFSWSPSYTQYAGMSLTNHTRLWVAISNTYALGSTGYLTDTPGTLTNTSNGHKFAGINYEGSVEGVTGNYWCCAGNGTTYGCTATTVPADAGQHAFGVSIPAGSASPDITCTIDGVAFKRLGSAGTSPASNAYGFATPHLTLTNTSTGTGITLLFGWNTLETL